jgi:hypothetical protein
MNENAPKGSPVTTAVLLVLHAVCGLAIFWLLLRLVPQYMKIFKDFNVKLPGMTLMVIKLATLFGRWWFLFMPGLAAGDIAIMLSLNGTGRTRLMTAWGILAWLAAMLVIGLILGSLFVPMNDLVINLSGGK